MAKLALLGGDGREGDMEESFCVVAAAAAKAKLHPGDAGLVANKVASLAKETHT